MSESIFSIFPDPEPWLALEPEELAGPILEHLNFLPEKEREMLNPHNFSTPQTMTDPFRHNEKKISRALMEAWGWMEREEMMPEYQAPKVIRISSPEGEAESRNRPISKHTVKLTCCLGNSCTQ